MDRFKYELIRLFQLASNPLLTVEFATEARRTQRCMLSKPRLAWFTRRTLFFLRVLCAFSAFSAVNSFLNGHESHALSSDN